MATKGTEKRRMLEDGLADTTPYPLGLEVERAEGLFIHLTDGRRIADLVSGVGVSSFGHSHPAIKAAIHHQVDRHLHTMVYGEFRQSAQVQASAALRRLLPPNLDAVYFVNSGAEAVEGALKLAKRLTRRTRIIAIEGGYHGNTAGALSVSSNAARKAPFLPLLPEVTIAPWNTERTFDFIDQTTAAVIVETVQGDAGIRIPDVSWLQGLRERCTATGTLLILDEIQAGMGRTGRPFAFAHFDIEPDILCLGKALGGGMPIGAFAAASRHMDQLSHHPKLGHITTFGGHPVCCAAAATACELLAEQDWERIELRGKRMEAALAAMPHVRAVRRLGYFIAVELDSASRVQRAVDGALDRGLLIFYFLSVPHAFRLAPPLTISDAEIEWSLKELRMALENT
jgi:acetylornithine/succinyldiaminopimelate/putrescine aminotransferase